MHSTMCGINGIKIKKGAVLETHPAFFLTRRCVFDACKIFAAAISP